jgi:hypothetical protein
MLNPFRKGIIYADDPPTGVEEMRGILKTTPLQDAQALKILESMRFSRHWYSLTNSCRTFSQEMFNHFKKMYPECYKPWVNPHPYQGWGNVDASGYATPL